MAVNEARSWRRAVRSPNWHREKSPGNSTEARCGATQPLTMSGGAHTITEVLQDPDGLLCANCMRIERSEKSGTGHMKMSMLIELSLLDPAEWALTNRISEEEVGEDWRDYAANYIEEMVSRMYSVRTGDIRVTNVTRDDHN